jgi:hypothetical protein
MNIGESSPKLHLGCKKDLRNIFIPSISKLIVQGYFMFPVLIYESLPPSFLAPTFEFHVDSDCFVVRDSCGMAGFRQTRTKRDSKLAAAVSLEVGDEHVVFSCFDS